MTGRYDDLAARLEAVAADIDEIAFDQLREAAADGRGRPGADRSLMQARRSIDKALGILRRLDDVDGRGRPDGYDPT